LKRDKLSAPEREISRECSNTQDVIYRSENKKLGRAKRISGGFKRSRLETKQKNVLGREGAGNGFQKEYQVHARC